MLVCITYFWNIIFYGIRFLFVDLSTENDSKLIQNCDIIDPVAKTTFSWLILLVTTLIPGFLMITCSLLIIRSIYLSRNRVKTLNINKNIINKRIKKDIQFSLIILSMNILFLVFNFPVCLAYFYLSDDTSVYLLCDLLFYSHFVCNVFVYLFLNKVFKQGLLSWCKRKHRVQQAKEKSLIITAMNYYQ